MISTKHKGIVLLTAILIVCFSLNSQAFAVVDRNGKNNSEKTRLTISEGITDDGALSVFIQDHPEIDVESDSISTLHDDIAERLMARDNTIDLYRMDANLGILPYMRDKGYFLDLSGNKDIRELTQSMAPVFQNQMSANGQIMLNDNAFIYPMYDRATYKLIGLYPLNPMNDNHIDRKSVV